MNASDWDWVIVATVDDVNAGPLSAEFGGATLAQATEYFAEWRDGCGLGARDLGARLPVIFRGEPCGHISCE